MVYLLKYDRQRYLNTKPFTISMILVCNKHERVNSAAWELVFLLNHDIWETLIQFTAFTAPIWPSRGL